MAGVTDPLRDLRAALSLPTPEFRGAALSLPARLDDAQVEAAAALALQWGAPRAALAWSRDPLRRAAAHLRLGESGPALAELAGEPAGARVALLRARAAALSGAQDAPTLAAHARTLARQEGDSAALIAAATLLAEGEQAEPYAALRTLAEGLKVAEIAGQSADPHLLAVLAHTQARLNARKGQATAAKSLERSAPRSPARVLALLALVRPGEAHAEARAGDLHPGWWAFSAEFRGTEGLSQSL
ncbi:hypothetical protein [Deinococcus actinosclerus]|uniref:Uncharacterized protein n=1 Tax=Deinococcus actinosclerus TaxID=1768108 RepID=A0ABN4K864_9DEIO|nr:hypothetical protein AUC44_10575 [Deinococcus actinosclerus]